MTDTALVWSSQQACEAEPPLRYFLAGRTIGVSSLSAYVRTIFGLALLVGLPAPWIPLLARSRLRPTLPTLTRWWAQRIIRHLDIRLDMAGLEQIDRGTTYMIVPLHESFADVLALLHIPLPMRFVVRDELFGWRLLGPCLQATGQICVTPERPSWSYRQLRHQIPNVIAAGESIVIFPQGTILGIESDFLPGAFALAHRLRLPLLPIAISGGHRVWEYPYTPRLRYGERLSMRILPPISADEVATCQTDELRISVRRKLKQVALAGEMAAPRRFVPARDGYWDGFSYRIDPDFPALAQDVEEHRRQAK